MWWIVIIVEQFESGYQGYCIVEAEDADDARRAAMEEWKWKNEYPRAVFGPLSEYPEAQD